MRLAPGASQPNGRARALRSAAFPGLEERRRADGGAASERWRELIAANRTHHG